MRLSENQIRALIDKPKYKDSLLSASLHHKRLCMHVEGLGINAILNKVSELLTESKMTNFKHLLEAWSKPLFDEMSNSLFKIHNAKGRVSNWQFREDNESAEENFYNIVNKSYLGGNPKNFYESKGWSYLLTAPNTVLLTDMPKAYLDENTNITKVIDPATGEIKPFQITEPYNVVIPLDSQHDICIKGNKIQYIIVKSEIETEKEKIEQYFIVDSEKYVKCVKLGEELVFDEPSFHELGYCPAVTISQTDRFTHCEIQKKSPFSDALDLADEYVILYTAIKNSQMRTAYKKEWEIETRDACGASNCNDGFIFDDINNTQVPCGNCEELKRRNKSAFGRLITIPNPDNLGENALRLYANPVGENSSDVALLQYQKDVLKELEQRIKDTCLGQGFTQDNPNVSKNQLQVMSNYDSIESVLNFWSNDIAYTWKFQNDTIARLSYGNEFEYSSFSLGSKYFLKTEEQIEQTEEIARRNGQPNYILESLRKEKIATKYKNNPEAQQRAMVLEQLEPLKEYNIQDLQSLLSVGVVTQQEITFKVRFVDLINRYERENGTIKIINNDLESTINSIKEQLNIYINE